MSLVPATVDLTGTNQILQGTDWVRTFACTSGGSAIDLTVYTGAGAVLRCNFRSTKVSATIVLSPTITIVSPATDGLIRMTITPSQTESLGTATLSGVYDIELVSNTADGNKIERVIQGAYTIDPEVTHT